MCEHSAGGVCPMCDPDPLDASLDYMIQVWKDEGDDYALDVMGDLIPARLLLTAIKRISRGADNAN